MNVFNRDTLDRAAADAAVRAMPVWIIRPVYGRADLIKRADASSLALFWGGIGLQDEVASAWMIIAGVILCLTCRVLDLMQMRAHQREAA